MTIEKLKDREWYLPDVTAKINEIIDYINSKETTSTTKVDIAGNDGKERY